MITVDTLSAVKWPRYLFYVAFGFGALLFWPLFAYFVMGWAPIGDPPSAFEPRGCEPTFWKQAFNMIVVYGAVPATALLFVFYRRWIRRMFRMDE